MLQNMNPRERTLMMVTVAAVALFGAWQLGLGDVVDGATSGGNAGREERLFRENLSALEDIYDVSYRYRRIGQVPDADNKDLPPTLAFQQEVFDISQKIGFNFPPIRAQVEDIEDVDDYQLLSVAIKTQGNFDDTVKLLKAYEANGLIFREVELRANRDKDIIDTTIVVSRIAERMKPRRATAAPR